MGDRIRVETTRLGSDAEKAGAAIREMKTAMEAMRSDVNRLSAMWSGPASKAFHQAFQNDMDAMTEVIKSLEQFQKFEKNAKSNYEKCEKKVADKIAAIRI